MSGGLGGHEPLTFEPGDRPQHLVALPGQPESARAARGVVHEALAEQGATEWAEVAELLVSELATNAIVHACAAFEVVIRVSPREIWVGVVDPDASVVHRSRPSPDAPGGRGLMLVDLMASRWGAEQLAPHHKVVWFALDRTTRRRGVA